MHIRKSEKVGENIRGKVDEMADARSEGGGVSLSSVPTAELDELCSLRDISVYVKLSRSLYMSSDGR